VATLRFSNSTDVKVFNAAPSAIQQLSNGAGTMIALLHKTFANSGQDIVGLVTGTTSITDWFHAMQHGTAGTGADDDGLVAPGTSTSVFSSTDTTSWFWFAVDFQATASTTERFHSFNHTTPGSWTHTDTSGNRGTNRVATSGAHWRIGKFDDNVDGCMDCAVVACWVGKRFANTDYSDWTKTSDLWNHSQGNPDMLIECNTTTPTDLGANASTYSSGSSSGTSLAGSDPPNWTFDGRGSAVPVGNKLKRWAY